MDNFFESTGQQLVRALRRGFAPVLLGVMLLGQPGAAESRELPVIEEELVVLMRNGQPEEGREGFRALVAGRLEAAQSFADDANARSVEIGLAARALRIWEKTEFGLELDGQPMTPAVVDELIATAERIHAQTEALRRQLAAVGGGGVKSALKAGPSGSLNDFELAEQQVNRLLNETVALSRDRVPGAKRSALLSKAASSVAKSAVAVTDLATFDAANPDLPNYLGVVASEEPAQLVKSSTGPSRRLLDAELAQEGDSVVDPKEVEEVRALFRAYLEGLISGQIGDLRELFAKNYWPEDGLVAIGERLAGGEFVELGPVWALDVDDEKPGEVEVTAEAIQVQLSGVGRTLRDQLILRRQGGSLRIVFVGSAAERRRELAGQGGQP